MPELRAIDERATQIAAVWSDASHSNVNPCFVPPIWLRGEGRWKAMWNVRNDAELRTNQFREKTVESKRRQDHGDFAAAFRLDSIWRALSFQRVKFGESVFMKRFTKLTCALTLVALAVAITPAAAEAGPLLDWLRRTCGCKQGCGVPAAPAAYAGMPTAYAGAPIAAANPNCGLQPGQCQVTCNQTCSRVVVNYVPYTAYRTSWEQVPVTQYKPVTNSDPCTGCSVTCMKPCTSYVWQAKQVPYTTYRACYRTENYTVPVTYVTNDCATGNCATGNCPTGTCGQVAPMGGAPMAGVPAAMTPTAGCSTCNVPGAAMTSAPQVDPNFYAGSPSYVPAPATYNGLPSTTTSMPAAATPTPADSVPAIQGVNPQSMQRPVIEQLQASPAGSTYAPPSQVPNINLQTSTSTTISTASAGREVTRQAWAYSPVRLASFEQPVEGEQQVIQGQWQTKPQAQFKAQSQAQPQGPTASELNAAWKTVNW